MPVRGSLSCADGVPARRSRWAAPTCAWAQPSSVLGTTRKSDDGGLVVNALQSCSQLFTKLQLRVSKNWRTWLIRRGQSTGGCRA
eukprot:353522-Chlamydomonas_euryale.AAC.3